MISNHKHDKERVQEILKILRNTVPTDEIHKLELKTTEYFIQGEYDKSIEIQNKIIQLEPDNELAWENKGYSYCLKGKFDKAIKCKAILCFKKIVKLKPENIDALFNFGSIYEDIEKLDKASEYYKKL